MKILYIIVALLAVNTGTRPSRDNLYAISRSPKFKKLNAFVSQRKKKKKKEARYRTARKNYSNLIALKREMKH